MFHAVAMLLCDILVPSVMVCVGYAMEKNPPTEQNRCLAYRTHRSRLSRLTWEFAQVYCGRVWFRMGLVLLVPSLLLGLTFLWLNVKWSALISIILLVIQIAALLASSLPVERELKLRFDENGDKIGQEPDAVL